MVKKFIKDNLPPFMRLIAKSVYRKFKKYTPDEITYNNRLASLKESHVLLNKNAKENQLFFRPGICLNVHPQSRFGFEHFCFVSPEMVDEMDFFIEKTIDKKALLDVGALHGIFSLVFSFNYPAKKAVAVDPSLLAFERLKYNIQENNLENVISCNYALSDAEGKLNMHYEWEHAVAAGTGKQGQQSFETITKTGDELCESLSFEPDVIKIDVEGHEVKVLKGLIKTIERFQPLVFLEVHPERIKEEGDDINEVCLLFKGCNYKAFLPGNAEISYEEIGGLKNITRLLLNPL